MDSILDTIARFYGAFASRSNTAIAWFLIIVLVSALLTGYAKRLL